MQELERSEDGRGTETGRSGPRSLVVPHLAAKLDRLLILNAWTQQQLAGALAVTAQAISNWKKDNIVPAHRARMLVRLLGTDLATLAETDMAHFEARLSENLVPGSGRRWQKLAKTARDQSLDVRVEPARPPRTYVGRVLRHPPPPPTSATRRLHAKDRIRFVIDPAQLSGSYGWDHRHVVLLVDDPLGMVVLTPSPDGLCFTADEKAWLLPGAAHDPLYFDDPTGPHVAFAVLSSRPLPVEVSKGLIDATVLLGADMLASWLLEEQVPHAVLRCRFHVQAAEK